MCRVQWQRIDARAIKLNSGRSAQRCGRRDEKCTGWDRRDNGDRSPPGTGDSIGNCRWIGTIDEKPALLKCPVIFFFPSPCRGRPSSLHIPSYEPLFVSSSRRPNSERKVCLACRRWKIRGNYWKIFSPYLNELASRINGKLIQIVR